MPMPITVALAWPSETFGFAAVRPCELSRRAAVRPGEPSRRPAPELEAPAIAFGAGMFSRRMLPELLGRPFAFGAMRPAPAVARGDWRVLPRLWLGFGLLLGVLLQAWQTMAPLLVEKGALPTALLHVPHTMHSGWKEPRAHFIVAPPMTSPHAAHFSPKRSKKQGVQKAAFPCIRKAFPDSCTEQPLHLKHSAWSLPPSCETSTTLPPLMGSLQTEHMPRAHCVVLPAFAFAIALSDILKGPLCIRARMNMSVGCHSIANSMAAMTPNVA
mmetsp:Transcript_15097/g.47407  ORF Transcript_15097/g.47407 Transcript_15097/m.47407 type:complete len:271 (+) Transcript_15097:117-929(+)